MYIGISKLYSTLLRPTLLSGSEVCDVYDYIEEDKPQTKFCKQILEINEQLPNCDIICR